jgi:hypothetical protein
VRVLGPTLVETVRIKLAVPESVVSFIHDTPLLTAARRHEHEQEFRQARTAFSMSLR